MEIEIVNYYPRWWDRETKFSDGSLHIYIPAWNLDIRGIMVKWNGKMPYVRMPQMSSYDFEKREKVLFPVLGFTNTDEMKDFIELIRKELKPYLENYAPESHIPRALAKKSRPQKKTPGSFSERKPASKNYKHFQSTKDYRPKT